MVPREEGRMSWEVYHFSPGEVEPCIYGFLILVPRGHGAVKITFSNLKLQDEDLSNLQTFSMIE